MTYKGEIHNGSVVLNEPIALPEGAKVECILIQLHQDDPIEQPNHTGSLQSLLQFAGVVKGTPPDASSNHDKYTYQAHPE